MDYNFLQPSSDVSSETLHGASSSGFSLTPVEWPSIEATTPLQPTATENRVAKKRGRKGHTKSRTGCYNCKRARIKCKENRPSCDYCAHRGLQCEWPDIQITQMQTTIRSPTPAFGSGIIVLANNPQASEPVFNMHDFRYFHHFIENAYPHQPLGNDSIWKHEVPCLAANHEFLLHSMLALGAADLATKSGIPSSDTKALNLAAMTHRVQAIESLNSSVAVGISSPEQGNAMLATCYALLFHSVLLNDGLAEFMAFIRGCVAVAMQMGRHEWKFVFENWQGPQQMEQIEAGLKVTPLIDGEVVGGALRSLETLGSLCQTKVEIGALGLLMGIARNLITSSKDAYVALSNFYAMFMTASHEDFRTFTDPSQEVCQALLAHFVSLQIIMTPISKKEWEGRQNRTGDGATMLKWLTPLHEKLTKRMRLYCRWTVWVEEEAASGRLYNGEVSRESCEAYLMEGELDN